MHDIAHHCPFFAGAAAASTHSQSAQRIVSKSRATDLIAPSLVNLPNALSAEYWLNKVRVQEQLGNHQVRTALKPGLGIVANALRSHMMRCCHYSCVDTFGTCCRQP